MSLPANDLNERVLRIRAALMRSPEFRQSVRRLAPEGSLDTPSGVVDFCDWQDFHSVPWNQVRSG